MIRPISRTYVRLVKDVALGLSVEDGEEMARGLYSIRPHERFTTHLLGSAWLCYYVMLAWFWAPMVVEVALEQQPDQQRIADYELTLQAGVRALNIWKVCRQNVGIAHGWAKRPAPSVEAGEPDAGSWGWLAACAALLLAAVILGQAHHGPVLVAAFTPFYIDQGTGASDLNAGTTSANAGGSSAAAFTYAGGTFVRATGVFTVASGNPQTDGVTTGTYASVYTTSGATSAKFVAQITARDTTTITVDVTTLKWGLATTVSETAAASTLKVSGAWSSFVPVGSAGLGTFTVPTSTKFNIKTPGTWYPLTVDPSVGMNGSTTAGLWFSGYNTTPGDLDADTTNALLKPQLLPSSTVSFTTSGAYQTWSSVILSGSRSDYLWNLSGNPIKTVRCRVTQNSTNAAAFASKTSFLAGTFVAYGYQASPTNGTTTGTFLSQSGSGVILVGTVLVNSGIAGASCGTTATEFVGCVFLSNTGAGLLSSTGAPRVYSSTFYGATVDGIKWTGTPGAASSVVGCLFSGLNSSTATTNGINNASGMNTDNIFRACNDYYNVTNPEVGMGDSPAFFPQTDSNPVVVSAADMTPVPGSNARGSVAPMIFENQTFYDYHDRGAVQHRTPARASMLLGI